MGLLILTIISYLIVYGVCLLVFNLDKKYFDNEITEWIDFECPILFTVLLLIPLVNIVVAFILIITMLLLFLGLISCDFEKLVEKLFIIKEKKKDEL